MYGEEERVEGGGFCEERVRTGVEDCCALRVDTVFQEIVYGGAGGSYGAGRGRMDRSTRIRLADVVVGKNDHRF